MMKEQGRVQLAMETSQTLLQELRLASSHLQLSLLLLSLVAGAVSLLLTRGTDHSR